MLFGGYFVKFYSRQIFRPYGIYVTSCSEVASEQSILEYLKNGTLVGLLPVPHPIIVRRYRVIILVMCV